MIKQLRAQGAHLVDIAHKVGCSARTVRRSLALPVPPSGKPKVRRASKLDPFKSFIDQQLARDVWNAEVIFQQLREQGYVGSATLVRDYIHPKRTLRASKQTVRYETLPGKQLQHDWGQLRTEVAGRLCTVNIAVNVLGYSRYCHVWAGPRQDAEHTYESLVQAFRYFGGVPASVLVDNQKAAVVQHRPEGNVTFNPGFLALANHYGFVAQACRPQRPRTKGKTERILPRPVLDFDTRYYDVRQVGWDAYIDVRGNRYSVPAQCCGRQVSIRISLEDELTVYDLHGQQIARHRLVDRRDGWQAVTNHHSALWQDVTSVQRRSLAVYEEVLQ